MRSAGASNAKGHRMKPSQLAAWISSMVCTAENEHGELAVFELVHVVQTPSGESLVVVARYRAETGAKFIADQALADAREDAATTGGAQRFALVAKAGATLLARRVWVVQGGSDLSTDLVQASEPPTPTGQTAMLMRHQEATMRLALGNVMQSSELAERSISRLEAENERLRKERLETEALREELNERNHQRNLERIAAESRAHIQASVFQNAVLPLLPLVVAKVSGRPMSPQAAASAPGEVSPLDSFIASIDPDQIDDFQRFLRPAQLVLLDQIFKEAQARAAARGAQPKPPPEEAEVQ